MQKILILVSGHVVYILSFITVLTVKYDGYLGDKMQKTECSFVYTL